VKGNKTREGGLYAGGIAGLLCGRLLCESLLFFTSGIIAFLVGIEGERLLLMGRVDVKSICGSGRGR
jgi:hypothetical protein